MSWFTLTIFCFVVTTIFMTLTLKNTHHIFFFFNLKPSHTHERRAWGHRCVAVKALAPSTAWRNCEMQTSPSPPPSFPSPWVDPPTVAPSRTAPVCLWTGLGSFWGMSPPVDEARAQHLTWSCELRQLPALQNLLSSPALIPLMGLGAPHGHAL